MKKFQSYRENPLIRVLLRRKNLKYGNAFLIMANKSK